MKDIYLYSTINSWIDENPDTTLRGRVVNRANNFIEIEDENGFVQIINMDRLFAIVY